MIYDTIHNADPRIKAASVEYPKYQTFVVYKRKNDDGKYEFPEQRVDSNYEPADDKTELVRNFRTQIFGRNVLAGVTPLYDVDNTFSYGVNQTNIHTYDGIQTITTKTTIHNILEEGTTSRKFKVGKNESILLTCPSFVEDNSFSSYVKVIHNLPEITANTKYTLEEDNYFIMFFWKAADTDEYYTYLKVTKDSKANIVCPSFTLNNTFDGAVTDYFMNNFSEGSGTTNRSDTITVDGKPMSATDYVASLSNQANKEVLTGTNIIKLYRSNKITVNDSTTGCSLMYWLLHNENNVLFSNSDSSDESYTLGSGEYFYYTNKERTLLHILGEGTVISATQIKMPPQDQNKEGWGTASRSDLSHEQILTQGIQAIKNWQTISSDIAVITCQERKRVLLGPGTTLDLYYEEDSDVLEEITSTATSLNNCSINYTDENNNTTSLEKIDGDDGWDVSAILNLNFSSTKPQVLTETQEIIIPNSKPISDCYVLGSHEVNKVGGTNIYVNDISGIKVYDDLQLFTYTHKGEDGSIKYASEGFTATLQLKESASSKTISFDALPGDYLLRVTQVKTSSTDTDVEPTVTLNGAPVGSKLTPINKDITKLIVPVEPDKIASSITIEIALSESDAVDTADFMIHPLYKYTNKTLESLGLLEDPEDIKEITKLDPYNNFDYTRTIEQPINNPLVPESFLNTKHAYNPYVISQWLLDDEVSGIQVSNALR